MARKYKRLVFADRQRIEEMRRQGMSEKEIVAAVGVPVLEAPWDKAFQERFCAMCKAKNCDAENCEHMEERNNPHWWLALKR